ncbi:hypothetical protein KKC60_03700, partial [Patescibacteria group bacterium]|nr:hypothetical protein [Patescibacteria group bacterium]
AYLEENTKQNEFYTDLAAIDASLSLYTNRSRIGYYSMLEQQEFKDSVQNIGFAKSMDKYHIKYLILHKNEINYGDFVNIFLTENINSDLGSRTPTILSAISQGNSGDKSLETKKEAIEKLHLEDKFKLEKKIGDYYFFRFVN